MVNRLFRPVVTFFLVLAVALSCAPSANAQIDLSGLGEMAGGVAGRACDMGLDLTGLQDNDFANGLCSVADTAVSAIPGVGAANQAGGVAADVGGAAVDAAGNKLEETVNSAAGKAFDGLVQTTAESMGSALIWCMTLWIQMPTAMLAENNPGQDAGFDARRAASEATQTSIYSRIQDYTMWLQIILLAASVVMVAARMALARRASSSIEEAESALMAGGKVVLASILVGTVVIAAARAGDNFSQWVIDEASQGNAPAKVFENIGKVLMGPNAAEALGAAAQGDTAQAAQDSAAAATQTAALMSPGTIAMIVFLLAIAGIIGMLVMVVFVIIRQIFLIFVVAFMPMAAAASGMQFGQEAWSKMLGWTIALLLFKPVGSLAIAVGLWIGESEDPAAQLMGLLVLVMSWLILPALMKLVVPATAQVGAGPSNAAITGAVAGTAIGVGSKAAMAFAGGGAGAGATAGGSGGAMAPSANPTPKPGGTGGSSGNGVQVPPGPQGGTGQTGQSGQAAQQGNTPGSRPHAAAPPGAAPQTAPGSSRHGGDAGTAAANVVGDHHNPTPLPRRNINEVDQ